MKILQYFAIFSVLLLSACGGGGGESDVKTGYFRDSAVKGLTYKTKTQTGTTDELGGYQYKTGEVITFSLGVLVLGSATASEALYPHNIAKNYEDSIRIAQLLQTLDIDSNVDNGIDATDQFKGTDVKLPDEDLSQKYIDDNTKNSKTLVTKVAAQAHLKKTRTQYKVSNTKATISILGNAAQNATLVSEINDLDGVPNSGITYQWYANNTLIDGESSNTLTLTQSQVGKSIKVQASFTDLMGAKEAPVSNEVTQAINVIIGYFKGSAVKGLKYITQTQTGTTNELGSYQYIAGERIKFYLGGLYLGQSLATEALYPSDIASNNQEMVKITQILQTLDADNNPDNGINVSRQFPTQNAYLPDGDLSQMYINIFDASKTLVSKATAEQFLINAIANDRNTNGWIGITSGEEGNYNFDFSSTGLREFEIPTLACAQVSCCKAKILKEGATEDYAIVDQNRIIRFNTSQQTGETITLKIQPVGVQTCYYKTPIASNIEAIESTKKTISAQGDDNDYPVLNVVKSNQHYYLYDVSRNATIKTIKSIGLGYGGKHIKHTAITAAHLDKDGVDAHANSIKTYEYLKTILGMSSYDNQGASLSATTNYLYPRTDSSSCGSRSSAGSWFNAFHSGGNIYYTPAKPDQGYDKSLSSIVNVAAHEWGHAVTNAASQLIYSRESGAINEAFSDWLGIAVEQHYSTGEKSWFIGFSDKPFRSMENPSIKSRTYRDYKNYKILKDGQVHTPAIGDNTPDPDTYKGDNWRTADRINCPSPNYCANDYCGVHINSSVANKMFYLLSVGGTHNGITVTGIGTNNAMKIALDANRNQWTRSTGFHNAKAGMIAASARFGNTDTGVNMQQQVRLAWEAVNVLDSNE